MDMDKLLKGANECFPDYWHLLQSAGDALPNLPKVKVTQVIFTVKEPGELRNDKHYLVDPEKSILESAGYLDHFNVMVMMTVNGMDLVLQGSFENGDDPKWVFETTVLIQQIAENFMDHFVVYMMHQECTIEHWIEETKAVAN